MSNLVFWLLIATVAIAPLPFASNRPLPWSVLSAIVSVLLVLWGIDRIRAVLRRGAAVMTPSSATAGGPPPPTPAAVIVDRIALAFAVAFGALIVWYWFQASSASSGLAHPAWAEAARALGEALPGAIALDPGVASHQAMKLLAYGGVFFLAFVLCRDRQRARWAFIVLAAAGLAYAAYGLFALFAGYKTIMGLVPSAYSSSVTSTFINRNSYATYGGLCVIIAMGPLLSELRHMLRSGASPIAMLRTVSEEASPAFYIAALAVATGVMAVILTGSRAGVASLLVGLAVFGVGMLIVRDLSLRAFLALAVAGALCLAAALMLSGGFVAGRFAGGIEHDARWILFETGRHIAGERPIAGHGLGGFSPAFNGALQTSPGFDAYVDFAHNTYLELAVEGGIPALLLSLALAGLAVGTCIAALFARSRGTSFAIAAIAGTALVGGHSLVDFSLQMPAIAVTFMLMLGVASAQSLASERVRREITVGEAGPAEDKARKKRRRRRSSSGRPSSADDSVTPPPEFEMPWMRPGGASAAADSMRQALATPAPQVPLARDRAPGSPSELLPDMLQRRADPGKGALVDAGATAVAPTEPVSAENSTESYKAALARWQNLRQAAPGRPLTPPPTPDLPTPSDVWAALGRTPPSDDLARSVTEELSPIVDATMPQPPMPPAWPGEVRRPDAEPTPPEDAPDNPPDNVVHLPRSRRP